ncbi:MAG TPA: hypothetical protein PLO52_12855, partial [Flavobacterium alvei]|nr:hypothetical protein [Flavobacterium alvei]
SILKTNKMILLIENFLSFIYITAIVSFIIVAVLGIIIKLQFKNEDLFNEFFKFKIAKIAFPTLIISFSLIFSLGFFICKSAREEIQNNVDIKNNNKLYINGVLTKNDSLIKSIKLISSTDNDRNIGNPEIKVNLNEMKLRLVRDFTNKNKYWVFYENYKSTSKNCIGQIETGYLDKY